MAGNNNEIVIFNERATVEALKKVDDQVKLNIQTFITLKTQIESVNNLFRTGMPRDFTNGAAELADVLQKLAKIEQDFITLQNRLNQVQQRNTQSTSQASLERSRLREETRLLNREYRDQATVEIQQSRRLNASLGAYNRVELALRSLTVRYNELAIRKQLGDTLSAKEERRLAALQKAITKYDNALKSVDASAGNNRRNVGNYPQFDSLSSSLNQITREAPAAAVSMQTFFLAISNNLPIFFDAIKTTRLRLREASKEMVAAARAAQQNAEATALAAGATNAEAKAIGKRAAIQAVATPEQLRAAASAGMLAERTALASGATAAQAAATRKLTQEQYLANNVVTKAPTIWGALAKSLFSFQTLLSIGVTLLTLYGAQIFKWIKASFAGKDALDKLKESQNSLNEAFKSTDLKNAVEQIGSLYTNIKLARDGIVSKDRVLKEYNESLGKVIGNAKSLDEVEKLLAKNAGAYIQATLYKTAANIASGKAAEALIRAEEHRLKKLQEFSSRIEDTRFDGGSMGMGGGSFNPQEEENRRKRILEARKKRKADAIKIETDAAKAQTDIAAKFTQDAANIVKKFKFDGTQFFIGDDTKNKKERKDALNDAIKDLEAIRDRLLALNERYYIEGKINEEEYVNQIYTINAAFYRSKLKLIKGANATERKIIAETQLDLVKAEKERDKKLYEIQKRRLDNSKAIMEAEIEQEIKSIQNDRYILETERINQTIKTYDELLTRTDLYYASLIKAAGKNNEEILKLEAQRDEERTKILTKRQDSASGLPDAMQKDLEYYRQVEDLVRSTSNIGEQTEILAKSKLNSEERTYLLQKLGFQQAREQYDVEIKRLELDISRLKAKSLLTVEEEKQLSILENSLALQKKGRQENDNAERLAEIDKFKKGMETTSNFVKNSLNDLGFSNLSSQYDKALDEILNKTFDWKDAMILAASAVADALTMVSERQKEQTIANLDEQLKLSQENTELEISFITSRLDALNNIQEKTAEQIQERNALEDEARTVREQQQQRERLIAEQKARAEQRAAAQQALINGALAATMTLAQLGIPAGVIPAALALAFGVAQSVAIMSKNPIPQYYTGTDNALGGLAYRDERGAEMHTDKLGNIKSLGSNRGKHLVNTEPGDIIYTASETKDILSRFDSMPKVGTNLLSGNLLTNLHAPMILNNSIDSKEIADLIGKKFEYAIKKNNKSVNIYEENGIVYKQVGSKIPEAIGKTSSKNIIVKSKRSYKDFRD